MSTRIADTSYARTGPPPEHASVPSGGGATEVIEGVFRADDEPEAVVSVLVADHTLVPAVFAPQSLIVGFLLLVAGALALFARPKRMA